MEPEGESRGGSRNGPDSLSSHPWPELYGNVNFRDRSLKINVGQAFNETSEEGVVSELTHNNNSSFFRRIGRAMWGSGNVGSRSDWESFWGRRASRC